MRFPHKQLIVFLSLSLALSCGSKPKTFDVKRPVTREPQSVRTQAVNVTAAAGKALQTRRNEQVMFLVAGSHAKEQPDIPQEPSSVTIPSSPTVVTVPATSPWDCIAEAETGSDYTMHGSTYSTAFGVVNDIVEDYGTPEEQAQIFSGTASKETQIAVVSRFSNEHGFGGWGELTKQKCGL